MTKKLSNPAPIIAAVLLLLPVLYVGSYMLTVVPKGTLAVKTRTVKGNLIRTGRATHYLLGGRVAEIVYAPLERIDRTFRPDEWDAP